MELAHPGDAVAMAAPVTIDAGRGKARPRYAGIALAIHPNYRSPGVHKFRSYEEMKGRHDPAHARPGSSTAPGGPTRK